MVLLVAPAGPAERRPGGSLRVHPSNLDPLLEVAYAIAEPRFAGRLVPVLVRGAGLDALPWILRKFPVLEADADWDRTCDRVIDALRTAPAAAAR